VTRPASLDSLRKRFAACVDQVAGDDSYITKRHLACRRQADEWRRANRLRGAAWERDCLVAAARQADVRLLDVNAIRPRLLACATPEDYAVHRYFSIMSAFPTRDRPGRRMKFLLVDDGHPDAPVMAIATLSSAVSVLRARDEWIGWPAGARDSRSWQRLAYIMDLSTCIGVPPYNVLTSAKLLAHLMVSEPCLEMYCSRYARRRTGRLRQTVNAFALVVATGAFKTKTPTYRGIEANGSPIFQLIGKTRGYSSAHIPDDLYRELLERLGGVAGMAIRRRGPHVRFNNLRVFARVLGLDEESVLRPGQRRSVYVAQAATNAREFLRGVSNRLAFDPPSFDCIVKAWKERWLSDRLGKAHVLQALQQPAIDDSRSARLAG
jgi:Druantia protein DruA